MTPNNHNQNDTLYKLAKRRVYLRRSVLEHFVIYLLVNALLVVIFFLTTPGGYFWPGWSMLGWGIGLLCHAITTWFLLHGSNGTQNAVEREYQKLLQNNTENGNL